MTIKEIKRAEIIQQIEDGKETVLQASQEIQLSIRISSASLYRIHQQAHLASPRTRRAPHHRLRRMPEAMAGDLLQADGSDHPWKTAARG